MTIAIASLPDPTPEAAEISERLLHVIRDEIARAGGWIPFSRFMHLALYAPGLGYYSAGAAKVGRGPDDGSDFVTAPELTPLFARTLARTVAAVVGGSDASILELGGGSGRLAADLLLELEVLGALPSAYLMLEVSADLRDRQRATLRQRAPHLASRVEWLDAMPAAIDGFVFGNEVLDALPVDLVVRGDAGWLERGVADAADGLVYEDRPASQELLSATGSALAGSAELPPGYLTEIHRGGTALTATLLERMSQRSVLLWLDYGFPASEYYHPQRAGGTLMAHYRHRSSTDLLLRPGLQDLTSHVDFSAVARAADAAGGVVIGYASQASFLLDAGILGLLQGSPAATAQWSSQTSALQRLLSEAEMGELFKVIAIGRAHAGLPGFGGKSRAGSL